MLADCWTQIIQQLTCESARYHVSADKMLCGQRMFLENSATLKVHRSRLAKALGVERSHYPLTSPPTLLRQECDTLCTNIEEREFWAGWSVCPRWDSRPSRIFSPHQHNLATHLTSHHSAVQLLPRETSSKLRPDRPSAVTTGAPCRAMWQLGVDSPHSSLLGPGLNHPLTRYFLLHAAACA